METPQIAGDEGWERAHQELLAKEKEMMRAEDKLAAERRRAPMREVSTDFSFEGHDGPVGFLDLFEGRLQLGRQEEWEDTPAGRPQSAKYSWWSKHDEY